MWGEGRRRNVKGRFWVSTRQTGSRGSLRESRRSRAKSAKASSPLRDLEHKHKHIGCWVWGNMQNNTAEVQVGQVRRRGLVAKPAETPDAWSRSSSQSAKSGEAWPENRNKPMFLKDRAAVGGGRGWIANFKSECFTSVLKSSRATARVSFWQKTGSCC